MTMLETVKKIRESIIKGKGYEQDMEFTCYAPEAKKVFLAGTFNNWNTKTLPMKKNKEGLWRLMVKLSPGRYEYKYVVDGAWSQEMSHPDMVPNSFGSYNCVIGVE